MQDDRGGADGHLMTTRKGPCYHRQMHSEILLYWPAVRPPVTFLGVFPTTCPDIYGGMLVTTLV